MDDDGSRVKRVGGENRDGHRRRVLFQGLGRFGERLQGTRGERMPARELPVVARCAILPKERERKREVMRLFIRPRDTSLDDARSLDFGPVDRS